MRRIPPGRYRLVRLLISMAFLTCYNVYAQDIVTNSQATSQASNMVVSSSKHTVATQTLIGLLATYQSMQVDFNQAVYDGNNALQQQTTGVLTLKKPDRLMWQSRPPYAQTIVSDGFTLWVYDPDLEQVTIQSLDEYYNNSPAMLFSGDLNKLAERFLVVANPVNTAETGFTLYAKDPNSLYQSIGLWFKGDLITQMLITDTLGQKTSIVFSNQILNPTLADDLFKFKPPTNTDIIRQ